MILNQFILKQFKDLKSGGPLTILKKIKAFFKIIFLVINPLYILSVPILIIFRIIKPIILIRWCELSSARLGHFVGDLEGYCCEKDADINMPKQKFIDLFYLNKLVCNHQLVKMWKRKVIILPRWLLDPICKINKIFPGGQIHEVNFHFAGDRDQKCLYEKFPSHLVFTKEEEILGKQGLKKLGISENGKYVCLNVRDKAYLKMHYKSMYHEDKWQKHDYRDIDVDKFLKASEELVNRGYYVIRMGVVVEKKLNLNNPRIIDYANSGMRSDFMDIYLVENCEFCISSSSGFDVLAYVLRKPIVEIPMPLCIAHTYRNKHLMITKHHVLKKNNKELSLSEIFSHHVALSLKTDEFHSKGVELKEPTDEEIKDIVIEMVERLDGTWQEKEVDKMLQDKFVKTFKSNLKTEDSKALHGEIKARFGAAFLRKNSWWVNRT